MNHNLSLGVIGLSAGNGHPYSWSAIFNGYNSEHVAQCDFPVIANYLSKQKFPEDTIQSASVTHVWTQDPQISKNISMFSSIPNIVKDFTDLVNCVDAVLLARDDAENHKYFASPFLKAGIPIFIEGEDPIENRMEIFISKDEAE